VAAQAHGGAGEKEPGRWSRPSQGRGRPGCWSRPERARPGWGAGRSRIRLCRPSLKWTRLGELYVGRESLVPEWASLCRPGKSSYEPNLQYVGLVCCLPAFKYSCTYNPTYIMYIRHVKKGYFGISVGLAQCLQLLPVWLSVCSSHASKCRSSKLSLEIKQSSFSGSCPQTRCQWRKLVFLPQHLKEQEERRSHSQSELEMNIRLWHTNFNLHFASGGYQT
jgi:hypothetical protein